MWICFNPSYVGLFGKSQTKKGACYHEKDVSILLMLDYSEKATIFSSTAAGNGSFNPSYVGLFGKSFFWFFVRFNVSTFQSFLCWIIRKKMNRNAQKKRHNQFQSFLCWIIRKKFFSLLI